MVDSAVGGSHEVAVFEQSLNLVDAALCSICESLRRHLVFALRAGFRQCELACGGVAGSDGGIVGGLGLVAFLLAHYALFEEIVEAGICFLSNGDTGLGLTEQVGGGIDDL